MKHKARQWLVTILTIILIFALCEVISNRFEVIINHPQLSNEENSTLNALIKHVPSSLRKEFGTLFDRWKDTWYWDNYFPGTEPRRWQECDQYAALLRFCKSQGYTILPLIFQVHLQNSREYLTSLLIEDVTFQDFESTFITLRSNSQTNEDRKAGEIWIDYIKEILAYIDPKTGEIVSK